jgi:hypothetical protein
MIIIFRSSTCQKADYITMDYHDAEVDGGIEGNNY